MISKGTALLHRCYCPVCSRSFDMWAEAQQFLCLRRDFMGRVIIPCPSHDSVELIRHKFRQEVA